MDRGVLSKEHRRDFITEYFSLVRSGRAGGTSPLRGLFRELRRLISQRTRDALAAKKAQGVKLGGLNAKGEANRDEAKARAEALRPVLDKLKANGVTSLRAIASALNNRGIKTARGGEWSAMQVARVLDRLA